MDTTSQEGLARLKAERYRPGIRYLFRSPVSYRQLSYEESTGLVRCRSKRGGEREWHATEFLAVLAQHVPRPRQHLVTYASHFANATGNLHLEAQKIDVPEMAQEQRARAGRLRRYSEEGLPEPRKL